MSRNSITFTFLPFSAPSHSPPNTFRPELRHHTHSGQRQEAMPTMQGTQVLRLPPLRWCPAAHRHHSNTNGPWWNNQGNHFVGGEKWQRMNTPGFQARFVKMPGREAFITCNGSYLHLEQNSRGSRGLFHVSSTSDDLAQVQILWLRTECSPENPSDVVQPGQVTLLSGDSPQTDQKILNHDTAQSAFVEETKENDRPGWESKSKHHTLDYSNTPSDWHGHHGPM